MTQREATLDRDGYDVFADDPERAPVFGADGRCTDPDVAEVSRLQQRNGKQRASFVELPVIWEEGYGKFLETAPDATIVVGARGVISHLNAHAEVLFGYTRAELIGRHLSGLIPGLRQEPGGHLVHSLSDAGAIRMRSTLELLAIHKDGTALPIEVTLGPLQMQRGLATAVSIRDIRARAGVPAGAPLLAARLANAVESIQDAFALFDNDDRLILCNSVYRRLVGGQFSGAIIGKSYEELLDAWIRDIEFPSEAGRAFFRAHRLAGRQREDTPAFNVQMNDGRSLRVINRRTPEGGIVKTVWDLTDEVRLAEELREARAEAEGASRAKSDFLSSMSHELRTPLNAVLGFAQLLQRDKRDPLSTRHQERVEHILKGGAHLMRLIDDILDLSRIEARSISFSPEGIDVLVFLDELRATLEPMAARQKIGLEIDACLAGVPLVWADRTRFAQILMNFGSNAIKYNPPGGKVTFVVSTPRLGQVRVTVHDTGIGIPADKQDKLFQPFQRIGQETGLIEGTGIGLFITKRLAQIMNGDVGFRSAANEGSAFWVDMPVPEFVAPSSGLRSADPKSLAG
jgi:PAS domain S-box-containing protein